MRLLDDARRGEDPEPARARLQSGSMPRQATRSQNAFRPCRSPCMPAAMTMKRAALCQLASAAFAPARSLVATSRTGRHRQVSSSRSSGRSTTRALSTSPCFLARRTRAFRLRHRACDVARASGAAISKAGGATRCKTASIADSARDAGRAAAAAPAEVAPSAKRI